MSNVASFPSPPMHDIERSVELCVQAFVLEVCDNTARIGVTKVLCDTNNDIEPDPAQRPWRVEQYSSANFYSPVFTQLPRDYRGLSEIVDTAYSDKLFQCEDYDDVQLPENQQIQAGDFVQITDECTEGINENGTRCAIIERKVDKLPIAAEPDIETYIHFAQQRKIRIARQLMRTIAKREALAMASTQRIPANQPVRPFVRIGDLQERYVYGEGPVQDHFVVVEAIPMHHEESHLLGIKRFAKDPDTGKMIAYFLPYLAPLGLGEPGDELCEISIRVYSRTVHNPAVGEQKIHAHVDGVTYEMVQNPEQSSQYFDKPGHHIVSEGFRSVDDAPNASIVNDEQLRAFVDISDLEHAAAMAGIHQSTIEGIDFVDQPERAEEVRDQVLARPDTRQKYEKLLATIRSIYDNPVDQTREYGAILVLPKGMLDALEIELPSGQS